MTLHPEENSVGEEAAAWALKLSAGEVDEADRAALEAWLSAHPAHQRALEKAQKVLGMSDDAAEFAAEQELDRELRIAANQSRHRFLLALMIALSLVLAGFAILKRQFGASSDMVRVENAEVVSCA